MGEALTGGGTGEVLSREKLVNSGAPTSWDETEGHTTHSDIVSYAVGQEMQKRFRKFNLELHPDKTRLLELN
jgi:hypothetical protein